MIPLINNFSIQCQEVGISGDDFVILQSFSFKREEMPVASDDNIVSRTFNAGVSLYDTNKGDKGVIDYFSTMISGYELLTKPMPFEKVETDILRVK